MSQSLTNDEYLDLVDDDDNVISRMRRSEVYSKHLSNFRVVNAFIVNSQGELWIPRRTASKSLSPSCLDMSMGGHVESGENYEEALKREINEELNLEIDNCEYTMLGHLTPQGDGVSSYMNVYEIKSDEMPQYNKNDFDECFWLSPDRLFDLIAEGEKSKDDLPKLVELYYSK